MLFSHIPLQTSFEIMSQASLSVESSRIHLVRRPAFLTSEGNLCGQSASLMANLCSENTTFSEQNHLTNKCRKAASRNSPESCLFFPGSYSKSPRKISFETSLYKTSLVRLVLSKVIIFCLATLFLNNDLKTLLGASLALCMS